MAQQEIPKITLKQISYFSFQTKAWHDISILKINSIHSKERLRILTIFPNEFQHISFFFLLKLGISLNIYMGFVP